LPSRLRTFWSAVFRPVSTSSVSPSLSTTPVFSSARDTSGTLNRIVIRLFRTNLTSHSVGKQIVNVPSFIVRLDSQKHIDFSLTSPFGGGRPGRVRRKKAAAASKKEGGDDAEEEEE